MSEYLKAYIVLFLLSFSQQFLNTDFIDSHLFLSFAPAWDSSN